MARLEEMWRPVSGALPGFLSLLGIKSNGSNPQALEKFVQPVVELLPFLLEGGAENFPTTFHSINVLAQGGSYGHAVVVPDGQKWWVHHATARIGTPALPTVIEIFGAQVVCVMPYGSSELRGDPLSLSVASPTAADDSVEFAPPSLRGFWAPAGSTIYLKGSIDIEDAGGPLFTVRMDVKYTPVQV